MDEEDRERLRAEDFTAQLDQIKADAEAIYRNRPRVFNWGPVLSWLGRCLLIYSLLGIVLFPHHLVAMIALDVAVLGFAADSMPSWRITPASYWEQASHNATSAGDES